jgi:hypothetical protein
MLLYSLFSLTNSNGSKSAGLGETKTGLKNIQVIIINLLLF